MEFQIGSKMIGPNHKPFIIAEMSGNHNQSLERALAIVEAAAKAGADALKIQTYTADTMTLDINDGEFFISEEGNLWKGKSLYELYQEAYTPWEWHEAIFKRAKELGMVAFSTPFDETAVDFLESLDVPAYKIASFENTDIQLIRKIASSGKPIIMSTGMASVAELSEAVSEMRKYGCENIVLLKCTSTYPALPTNSNLATIPHMKQLFNCEIGLSDHTLGIGVSVASVALGATVIEKHFTLSRAEGGVDSAFSLEPSELAELVYETEQAWQAIGQIYYGATAAEKESVNSRRSLYISKDIQPGEAFTKKNIKAIRPGLGLPTKFLDQFIGKTARKEIKKGTPLSWELLND